MATFSSAYDNLVEAAAAAHAVPAAWIKAVIGAETSFAVPAPRRWEPKVNEYAYGPMQILLSTARGLGFGGTGADLEQPAINIDVGADYLSRIRGDYGNDFRRVYSAYNSGNPDRWLTSDQVRANVDRAMGWLGKFETGASGFGLLVILAAGAWWWSTQRRRK